MTPADGIPETGSGMIALRMPNPHAPDEGRENQYANLDFGPAGRFAADHEETNIVFRETEPGVGTAIVRGDHPLLDRLFQKYPQIIVVTGGPEAVFLCAVCDDGREFASKKTLKSHMRTQHKAEAEAKLEAEALEAELSDDEGSRTEE